MGWRYALNVMHIYFNGPLSWPDRSHFSTNSVSDSVLIGTLPMRWREYSFECTSLHPGHKIMLHDLQIYNDDEHIPRQLPCFHTFCSACLIRLGNRGNKIECSLCKTVHKIKQGSMVNFCKDNTRRNLLTFIKENVNGNGLAICSECNEILKLWFTCKSCSIIKSY
jgi:hypothetical protein